VSGCLSAHLNRRHGLGHVRTSHVVAMGNRLGWFLASWRHTGCLAKVTHASKQFSGRRY